ncbi:MAG: DUF4442 domain-containing protein [Gammaproteobacteria bacterium]
MKKAWMLRLINFWPPFLGAGIRVKKISSDFTSIEVEMKLRFWNKNYVGCHFGGSLYAMTDPFLMLMLMQNLGKDYIVWDKSASIDYKKPGKSMVHAHFQLSAEQINQIREQANIEPKIEPIFNEENQVVAIVEKKLYIRRKI